MTFKELEKQLLALTPAEKAQAIQLLAQSLSNNWQGITKTPGVVGGDACIGNTRIPVWSLASWVGTAHPYRMLNYKNAS